MHLCCTFTAYEGLQNPENSLIDECKELLEWPCFFLPRHGPKGGMPIHAWNTENNTLCEPGIDPHWE